MGKYQLSYIFLLLVSATCFYTSGFLHIFIAFLKKKPYSRVFFYVLVVVGFALHSIGLYYRGLELGNLPLTNWYDLLQVMSWGALFLVIITQIAFPLRLLGFFGSGLSTILSLIALLGWPLSHAKSIAYSPPAELLNPWIEVHATLAIFSYSLFGLLFITSIMYLLQDYGLSHKCFGNFFRLLAPLKPLEIINKRLLLIGVILLFLSISMGVLAWITQTAFVSMGKLFSAIGLLICYTILAIFKMKQQISLRKCAWLSAGLFILAIISLWPVQR